MRLAVGQHGVFCLTQLMALGLTPSAVRTWVQRGRVHRVHRGVYSLSPVMTPDGRLMAAVLASGPGAVLSHRAAAAHLGLRPDARARIDVSVPRRARSRPGLHVHLATTLVPEDVTIVDGIPCTSAARTLLDLAGVLDDAGVERALERAEILRVYDGRRLEAVLSRSAGHPGSSRLRRVLDAFASPLFTRSDLEKAFLAICDEAGVPRPETNVWIEGFEVDFLWRARSLVVEADSRRYHHTTRRFELDRQRDQLLVVAGYSVVRFTDRRIAQDPAGVGAALHALLAR